MSRVKRAFFGAIVVAVALAGIELASWLLLARLSPEGPEERLWEATVVETRRAEPGRARGVEPLEVIHPYVGYVVAPPSSVADGELGLEALGFSLGGPLVRERRDDTVIVGVFGGSAAAYFAEAEGPRQVLERLRSLPAFAERRLQVFTTAQGGYKQPQPLLTLAYLLSLGAKIDVVLLIDGFNDVVLAPLENAPLGVFPFFPRSWSLRVADPSLATETGALIGEIAWLARRRAERARWLLHSPLRRSRTVLLAWLLLDRSLAAELAARRLDLVSPRSQERLDYLARGPRWPAAGEDALYRDLVSVWKESSLQMRALCEGSEIRFYHFLQPNQYLPGSKPIGAEERAVAVTPGHPYARGVARGYPGLREAGRELRDAGVRFHDLTQIFSDVPEPLYVDDCCHLGPRGNALLAEAIAAAILADERG